jgi:predicted kinase
VPLLSGARRRKGSIALVGADTPTVVMMCGLPASGKTTTAGRLHARILIRSCDVYQALAISLPEWVRRTHGFTVDVAAYDRVRDQAYLEMARRLDDALKGQSAALIIVDAVHGEGSKREAVYAICHARRATPILLLCRCENPAESARRLGARRGREREPEHEASDLSVFQDISRRWCDPFADRLPDGQVPTIVTYDTCTGALRVSAGSGASGTGPILTTLAQPVDGQQGRPGHGQGQRNARRDRTVPELPGGTYLPSPG